MFLFPPALKEPDPRDPESQDAAYKFIQAAKSEPDAVQIDRDFSERIQKCLEELCGKNQDSQHLHMQINVIGGVAALLIECEFRKIKPICDPNLIDKIARISDRKYGDQREIRVGVNSMIALQILSHHEPELVCQKVPIDSAVSHVMHRRRRFETRRATYAAMMLANVAHHKPGVIAAADAMSRLREGIALDVDDDRRFAALAYCLQQWCAEVNLENISKSTRQSTVAKLTDMQKFASDESRAPPYQAIVVKSMIPICNQWRSDALETLSANDFNSIFDTSPDNDVLHAAIKKFTEALTHETTTQTSKSEDNNSLFGARIADRINFEKIEKLVLQVHGINDSERVVTDPSGSVQIG